MDYKCKLLELPDQPVLIMKTTTAAKNLPEFFGKAFGGIMEFLGKLGQKPAGMPFGAYYNMDMENLEVEAGWPVEQKIEGKGEIISSKIPGGKFASTIHVGSYDSVGPAYEALEKWAKDQGFEPTGVAYEYYLNDPSEEGVEPETEIRYSLK